MKDRRATSSVVSSRRSVPPHAQHTAAVRWFATTATSSFHRTPLTKSPSSRGSPSSTLWSRAESDIDHHRQRTMLFDLVDALQERPDHLEPHFFETWKESDADARLRTVVDQVASLTDQVRAQATLRALRDVMELRDPAKGSRRGRHKLRGQKLSEDVIKVFPCQG